MGAGPVRIARAEFVTPPEFRDLPSIANEAGRVGGVRLELFADGAFTRLGACYQQVPLRVLPPFQPDARLAALLYLLNPTAGLFESDAQLAEIVLHPGARALVVGQSATRIHPALHGFATQQWRIRVENGATLILLPGPTIPFRCCRSYQRLEVDLAPDAVFVWGDIGVAGRYARGLASERFQFTALVQEVLVRKEGQLVFRDRCCWRGPWDEATAAWHCGGAEAWGTLFVAGKSENTSTPVEPLRHGQFATGAGHWCFRWIGSAEEVTAAVVRMALGFASTMVANGSVEAAFGHHLGPCHWFTSNVSGSARPSVM
jgi:urease accessory protein